MFVFSCIFTSEKNKNPHICLPPQKKTPKKVSPKTLFTNKNLSLPLLGGFFLDVLAAEIQLDNAQQDFWSTGA